MVRNQNPVSMGIRVFHPESDARLRTKISNRCQALGAVFCRPHIRERIP